MSYSSDKDNLVKAWEYEYEKGSLLFAIMEYNDGGPKLQMTRMYKKKDDEVGYAKVGRMNKEEVQFLIDNSKEMLEYMKGG